MTVQSDINSVTYTGNGTETQFSFTYRVDEDSWMRVYVDGILIADTEYSVALNPDQAASPGGSVQPSRL